VIEKLVLRMVEENPSWGYDRVVGALSNLGCAISDETVGSFLASRGGTPPNTTRTLQRGGTSRVKYTVPPSPANPPSQLPGASGVSGIASLSEVPRSILKDRLSTRRGTVALGEGGMSSMAMS
jgi:hypothetical protein